MKADLERFAHSEYWDERYTAVAADEQVHEWLRSFSDLIPFFERHLFKRWPPETAPNILHSGSGDSTIPEDLAKRGYNNQICVDFSSVVVQTMSLKHKNFPGIVWHLADLRDMDQIPSDSVDVAFDKSTLDSMIHGSPWTPPDEVLQNTSQYIREIFRVLKTGGCFLCITYRQPHFIKPLVHRANVNWNIDIDTIGELDNTFGYFGFCLTKNNGKDASSAIAPLDSTQTEPEGARSTDLGSVRRKDGV